MDECYLAIQNPEVLAIKSKLYLNIDKSGIVVGSDEVAQWQVQDTKLNISPRHMQISFIEDAFALTPFEENDVFFNNSFSHLPYGYSVALSAGNHIKIGEVEFIVYDKLEDIKSNASVKQELGELKEHDSSILKAKKQDNLQVDVDKLVKNDMLLDDLSQKSQEEVLMQESIIKESLIQKDLIKEELLNQNLANNNPSILENLHQNIANDNIAKDNLVEQNLIKQNLAQEILIENLTQVNLAKQNLNTPLQEDIFINQSNSNMPKSDLDVDSKSLSSFIRLVISKYKADINTQSHSPSLSVKEIFDFLNSSFLCNNNLIINALIISTLFHQMKNPITEVLGSNYQNEEVLKILNKVISGDASLIEQILLNHIEKLLKEL